MPRLTTTWKANQAAAITRIGRVAEYGGYDDAAADIAARGALTPRASEVDAALASVELAERNLEAEQTKFDNGLSTNFQVLQIQDDLAQAQLTLIQAYLSYRRAMSGTSPR